MAWLEYEDSVGAEWRVTLVDGRVNETVIEAAMAKRHPDAPDHPANVCSIAELACDARRRYHMQEEGPFPYCNIFIMKASDSPATRHTEVDPADTGQDGDLTGATYLLQIEKRCPHYKSCLKNVIATIGMKEIPEREHADPTHYRQWGEELAEEVLNPYVAPCMIAEERIKRRGFECCGE